MEKVTQRSFAQRSSWLDFYFLFYPKAEEGRDQLAFTSSLYQTVTVLV